MRVTLEGWEDGATVRVALAAPDRAQAHAAERVVLSFDGDDATCVTLHQRPVAPHRLSTAVWDCGLALAEWVWRDVRERGRTPTVVELGAGVGAPSLAAAAAGAIVIATDVPAALAGLRGGAARNWLAGAPRPGRDAASSPPRGRVTVLPLTLGGPDWKNEAAAIRAALGAAPDLVLAADVVYPLPPGSTAVRPAAAETIAAAAELASPTTAVVIAFEARSAGDPPPETLRGELLMAAGAWFARVERLQPAKGDAFAGAPYVELYALRDVIGEG